MDLEQRVVELEKDHAAAEEQHKTLKGNSFIDRIRKEVDEWEVVT